ncbi:MAG: dehydrogenase [Acidobacteriota bacterium]|nr:dehydrogenase [Acidobacteriota bacterium]
MTPPAPRFEVAFSADFLNESGQTAFPDIGLSVLKDQPGISYRFLEEYRVAYTTDQISAVDVLISLKPRITEESLQGVERLTAIGRCGVGYDNVDLAACTARDIAVFITPAGVVRPVAESIVLFVLATSHRLVAKDRMIRAGAWVESTRELGREPRGRVVGTIGLGNIAREAVRLLRNFDVGRFMGFDPWVDRETATNLGVEMVGLEELMRFSDYVLVNCPLTPQTRGMIGERELGWMKPDAVLINTARGAIVQEGPLIEALASRRIGGAALDVFEREPLDRESPLGAQAAEAAGTANAESAPVGLNESAQRGKTRVNSAPLKVAFGERSFGNPKRSGGAARRHRKSMDGRAKSGQTGNDDISTGTHRTCTARKNWLPPTQLT